MVIHSQPEKTYKAIPPLTFGGYDLSHMKNRIKEYREKQGWSQYDLADKINTSATQIGRLENSKRRLSDFWMIKLAKVFHCRPEDLIMNDETKEERQLVEKYRGFNETQKAEFKHFVEFLETKK